MAETSPPKDLDVFGKELRLTSAEQNVLAGSGEIFLRKILQVDTFSKKGDPTEPKILVITNSRCYILSQRPAVKLDISFNFLKIQLLECTETKLKFELPGERPREFHSTRRDSVEIIGLITAQLKNVFPITPLEMILKLTFDPDSLRTEVTSLRDSLLSAMDRGDASSLQGFITSYAFLCDFFGVPFSKEVVWNLKNVYLAHGFRDLNLTDFNHLSTRDLLPVLSTLRHNEFFEGLTVKDDKMATELVEELCYVVNVTRALKKLVLHNASLRPENLNRMSLALKNNPRSSLVHLDLSDNQFDDKSIEALGSALENLPHGLQHLVLTNCKITNRAASMLAHSMKQNKHMQFSLVHFDLSGNPLGPDPLGAFTFIQDPQTISHLDLSNCALTLDSIVQVLIRGCQQHLATLNLSHNSGKGKKGVLSSGVAAKLQQFCSSCISISSINLAECRLTNEIVTAILEGLSVNPNITSIDLNVSSNDLGYGSDPGTMAKVISRTQCLRKLDISDCGLDHCLPLVIEGIAGNTKLRDVAIGKNFNGKQQTRVTAMEKLCCFLKKEDCHLLSLYVQDSKLKDLAITLLTAISDNTSLLKLNISGNQIGNHGARYLGKMLLTNCHLREVNWDHNDTTLCGLQDVIYALQHNHTLRVMPLPLADISRVGKEADRIVQEIQLLLCRNHSDERLKVELAARHRGRLLTATQQGSVVGRELVQLEDLLQWAESTHGTSHDDVKEAMSVKNEANKVLKLTDGLYSPQVESDQLQAITIQVKGLFESFMDQVYTEHIKATSDRMVEQTLRACPSLLTEEAKATIRRMVLSSSVSSDFTYAKKAVIKKAAPEVVSHVSAINLDVAANISELMVEQTLAKLNKANLKLMKLHKAARASSATPDTKVSRNFTFRVEQTTPLAKKKRVRRPDPEDDEEEEQVDLPAEPLVSEGPSLQHLGKTRPKPARMQRRGRPPPGNKPSPIPDTAINEEKPLDDKQVNKPSQPKAPLLPPTTAETASSQDQPEFTTGEVAAGESGAKPGPTEAVDAPTKPEQDKPLEPQDMATSPSTSPSHAIESSNEEKKPDMIKPDTPTETSPPEELQPIDEPKPNPDVQVPASKPTDEEKSTSNKEPSEPEKTEENVQEEVSKQTLSEDKLEGTPQPEAEQEDGQTVTSPANNVNTDSPQQVEDITQAEKDVTPPVEEKPVLEDKGKSLQEPVTPPVAESVPKSPTPDANEDDPKQHPTPEPVIILPAPLPAASPKPVSDHPSKEPSRTEAAVSPSPTTPVEARKGPADGKKTKERKRHGFSKIFGKKSKSDNEEIRTSPEPTQPQKVNQIETTSRQSGDWEVLEAKQTAEPSPPVKEKPAPAVREKPAVKPKQRPQPAEQEYTPSATPEPAPVKKLPGGVQMPAFNMNELTNALGKKKAKVPPPTAEKPNDSPKTDRRPATEPPVPRPRPKPRTVRKPPGEDRSTQGGNEQASVEPGSGTLDSLV